MKPENKIGALKSLLGVLRSSGVNRLKSAKKPMVAIHINKTEDESPEESMLHEKMESPLHEQSEEGELSIAGDDLAGRRSMMKKPIK